MKNWLFSKIIPEVINKQIALVEEEILRINDFYKENLFAEQRFPQDYYNYLLKTLLQLKLIVIHKEYEQQKNYNN